MIRDLERFVIAHRPCGGLEGDAEAPTLRGYRLWVSCACGARLERWVTPVDALDLALSDLPTSLN